MSLLSELEKLRDELQRTKNLVIIRRAIFNKFKLDEKKAQTELKEIRHLKYQSYKNWVNARKESKTAKTRLSSYPWRSRKWVKDNLGKVLSEMAK